MPRTRTVRGVIAAALTTALLAGCSSGPAGPLATVDGVEIPREQLEGWVRAATQANADINAVGLQIDLLSRMILQIVVDGMLAERGLSVDPALIAETRTGIEDQVGGPRSLSATLADIGFPEDYFDQVVVPLDAAVETLVLQLTAGQTLETRTPRHILVTTAEEAEEILTLLADGADFATLATERSQDPGSRERGGELGARPRGAWVPEFEEAVWSSPLNTVIGPVQTTNGFHVLEVTEEEVSAAADLTSDQRRQLVGQELDMLLMEALASVEVIIDPTIGTWDPATGVITPA